MFQFVFQQLVSVVPVLVSCLVYYLYSNWSGLRNGRIVAGTGTIDRDGNVGTLEVLIRKLAASAREGAAIFFAPDNPVSEEEQKSILMRK